MSRTKDFREVLLGGATYPGFLAAVAGQCCDNLLELQEQLGITADELAYLIDEEEDAIILAFAGQV